MIQSVPTTSLALVSMPWHLLGFPSIQLGTLQAVMEEAGLGCRSHSFHLELLRFLRSEGIEALDIDDFGAVGSTWATLGVGDWAFALPGVRVASPRRDEEYFELCRRKGVPDALLEKLTRVKERMPDFLEACADEVLAEGFEQTVAAKTDHRTATCQPQHQRWQGEVVEEIENPLGPG